MKIKEIQVDGFGAWSNLELTELADDLTVFYGPNEAGKTTLMQFIRGVLYGYSPERRRRYLPPVNGGDAGGSLLIDSSSGRVRVFRHPGANDHPDSLGSLKVVGADNSPRSPEVLSQLLSGVDEATFNNVFAVGLRELQELNSLDATDASQLLYNLTTGLDRVGLVEVMKELKKSRKQIVGGGEEASELEELLANRERLRDELAELEARNRGWYETIGELTSLRQAIEAQARDNEGTDREIRLVDAAIPIRVRWDERELLKNQLEGGDQRLSVAPAALERLAEIKSQIAQKRKQVKQLKSQRSKLKKEAQDLGIDPRITDNANRIESLNEQRQFMEALETQVRQLQPVVGVAPKPGEKLSLVTTFASLSTPSTPPPLNTRVEKPNQEPQVTSRVLSSLRGPARAVRDASRRLKSAKAERDRSHIQVEAVSDRLESELIERGESSLRAALDKAGALVSRLRRRIQIEERLEKMTRHRDELEQDVEVLLDESILPLSGLMWPGLLFIIGFTMLIASIFYEDMQNIGGLVTALGIFAVVASVLWKVNLERQSQHELDGCNRQLRSLNDQIRQIQDERDEVDRHLPQGGGSLDTRLTKAEQDLEHLQSLVPLDTDRQVAGQRGTGADRNVELAEEALAEAHDRWRTALRRNKLPETLKPSEIRDLADQTEEQQKIDQAKEQQRLELETRERELMGFWSRIDQLTKELKLQPKSEEPTDQLRLLTTTLKQQRSLLDKRSAMASKYKRLGKDIRRANAAGRKLSRQRQDLFAEMGVANEEELRQLDERKREAARLQNKIEEESARIEVELEALDSQHEAVEKLVSATDRDALEARKKRLESQLNEGQTQLTRLHQKQGALDQEVQAAGDDKRQDRLRLEIAGLNHQIGEAVRRWRVLNVSSAVLKKIRHDYENHRQPETLNIASKYLEQLTEGRYRRIWTPFGEAALRIENDQEQNLPLEVLSAGTREAVFVCLRLALASNFARGGAALPLVLDDVLVNFDVTRADAAAAVLKGYANSGHQMLLFTCHEHIMEAFAAAGAEIRVLPGRGAELLEERRRKRAAAEESEPEPEPAPEEEPEEVVAEETPTPPQPVEPQVMLVLTDEEQDDIDEEIEDELLDEPEEEEGVEVAEEPEPDFFAWKSFWFDDDREILDFAHLPAPMDGEPPADSPPVWETAEMWWDGEAPPDQHGNPPRPIANG